MSGPTSPWPERNTFVEWDGLQGLAAQAATEEARVAGLEARPIDWGIILLDMGERVGDEIIEALRSYYRPSVQRDYCEKLIIALREKGTGKPGL